MNTPISIIIPTFNAPAYLDLCIESSIEGQSDNNEVVVVVDGNYEINKSVLDKWKDKIKPIILETNMGLACATNTGAYHASNDIILTVNDDNVFPSSWDRIMMEDFTDNCILTPNQIEPTSSMFKQFHKWDYGKIELFYLDKWFKGEQTYWRSDKVTAEGSTLPFMMKKIDYLKIGGWDESYPGGNVVDWDFFCKCNLNGYKMKRTYKCNFYHFGSTTFKSPEMIEDSKIKEQQAFEYFKYKWGKYPKHNPDTNLKSL